MTFDEGPVNDAYVSAEGYTALRDAHEELIVRYDALLARSLTPEECKGVRMAMRFGAPIPTPPLLASAIAKLGAAEAA